MDKLFFRILFDEEAVITYPRDNMLRVSDGKWSTNKVIRVSETSGTSDFNKDFYRTKDDWCNLWCYCSYRNSY